MKYTLDLKDMIRLIVRRAIRWCITTHRIIIMIVGLILAAAFWAGVVFLVTKMLNEKGPH